MHPLVLIVSWNLWRESIPKTFKLRVLQVTQTSKRNV